MKTVIIDFEKSITASLRTAIAKYDAGIQIVTVLSSLDQSTKWFAQHPAHDVVFINPQFKNGMLTALFNQIQFNCPVIFITPKGAYQRQVFEFNNCICLPQPFKKDALEKAFQKSQSQKKGNHWNAKDLLSFFEVSTSDKKKILTKKGNRFQAMLLGEVAYCYADQHNTYLIDKTGSKYAVPVTLEQLAREVNRANFYRVNRKYLINFNSISKFRPHEKGQLYLELYPPVNEAVIVSRDKAQDFTKWMR